VFGVLSFDRTSDEMILSELHRGVEPKTIRENIGWEVKFAEDLHVTAPPTAEELRLIREELDPERLYI
ncbi:MAG: CoA-transferase subunit beta, partial [candidate division KSB1 bacterium]